MILYEAGDYHLQFIFSLQGSTIPKALIFSLPASFMAIMWRWLLDSYPDALMFIAEMKQSVVWSMLIMVLGTLLGFRTNKAYARFWEGTTLVQQMRAEWFEACNNLTAFSNFSVCMAPNDEERKDRVKRFQYTLVRLVSLMHAAALRQVTGDEGGEGQEEFDVLDVYGLDDESMDYLSVECGIHEINRVEVLLHWVQVLITDSIANGVLVVPPPILTRSYQTLSRGMVNLHNVRKLADVPFPFPLSQTIIVLMLVQSLVLPIFVAALMRSYIGNFVFAFLPMFGMWSITFIAGELEQPFGQDPNDLPLAELQFEMNNSLLMLLDHRAQRSPALKEGAIMDVNELRNQLGSMESNTGFLGVPPTAERIHRLRRNQRASFSGRRSSTATWNSLRLEKDSSIAELNMELSDRHAISTRTSRADDPEQAPHDRCRSPRSEQSQPRSPGGSPRLSPVSGAVAALRSQNGMLRQISCQSDATVVTSIAGERSRRRQVDEANVDAHDAKVPPLPKDKLIVNGDDQDLEEPGDLPPSPMLKSPRDYDAFGRQREPIQENVSHETSHLDERPISFMRGRFEVGTCNTEPPRFDPYTGEADNLPPPLVTSQENLQPYSNRWPQGPTRPVHLLSSVQHGVPPPIRDTANAATDRAPVPADTRGCSGFAGAAKGGGGCADAIAGGESLAGPPLYPPPPTPLPRQRLIP